MNEFKMYKEVFQSNLKEIESYITTIENQKQVLNELSSSLSGTTNPENFSYTKKYVKELKNIINSPVQYHAVIISLYGSLETFIDEIFEKFINNVFLNSDSYESLPEQMKSKHARKTGEFLSNPQRFQNYDLTPKEVAKNLHFCMSGTENASLNHKLILSHGGNLKIEQILELMRECGISNPEQKILNSNAYLEYFSEKSQISMKEVKKIIGKKPSNIGSLFIELKNLVEERNSVAHGWRVDNRIAYDLIKREIITFLKYFSEMIEGVILEEFYLFLKNQGKLNSFGSVIKVYKNKILCINSLQSKLKLGDFIFAEKDGLFRCLEILDLQVEGESYQKITHENVNIGIELNGKINCKWKFYYL